MEALGRLVRLTWKTLGSMLLFLICILIVIGSDRQEYALDVVFWSAVAGLILARYMDIKVFGGQTAGTGQTILKVMFAYSIRLVLTSGILWILAHVIRNRLH